MLPDATVSAVHQLSGIATDMDSEYGKVSWPTREELRDSTSVVIVTVLLVAAFISLVDEILNWAVGLVFH